MFRHKAAKALEAWIEAWNAHDLNGVMSLLHDNVVFENWDGLTVSGKRALRHAWAGWFENHGDFRFTTEEIFIDDEAQKALFMWTLEWPSKDRSFEGKREKRHGVDVLHFEEEKIARKLTYTKMFLEVEGKKIKLTALLRMDNTDASHS